MLEPIGYGENTVLIEKFPDLQFPFGCVLLPTVDVRRQLERRYVVVSLRFVCLKCDCAIPLLLTHREKFLRRVGDQRHVCEKENISVASERRFFWKRRHFFLKLLSKLFERVGRALDCALQLLLFESCRS